MLKQLVLFFATYFFVLAPGLVAQREAPASNEILQSLRRLNTLGSVLMIAAHPDDENTNLLAYYALGRHLRTGYLSLTRGEGGQNLIGPEQGELMGVIRTQELLMARRVDGAEQFFTRAVDFGFSKTAEETLAKWGRERVLADVVWVIRSFRPDILILRFSGTPRDGHGHHQSSAILGKEAYFAAADPGRFPEQLKYVQPWKAKRVLFNTFAFTPDQERASAKLANRLEIDAGEFNPLLGRSYGEIAGISRSQHASQGMGSAQRRGSIKNHLVVVAGDAATRDPLEGVDTSWGRLPGGAAVGEMLKQAEQMFRPAEPQAIAPLLLKARPRVAAIEHPDAKRKLDELDELLVQCLGIWADASVDRWLVTPGSTVRVQTTVVQRMPAPVEFLGVEFNGVTALPKIETQPNKLVVNEPLQNRVEWMMPATAGYTQPFWLARPRDGWLYGVEDPRWIGMAENPPPVTARFRFRMNGIEFFATRAVSHRYVDSVLGERTRPLVIGPPVVVELRDPVILFPSASGRRVDVLVRANQPPVSGVVKLRLSKDWKVQPAEQTFELTESGQQATVSFQITPPASEVITELQAVALVQGREYGQGMRTVSYPHIPPQTVFPAASAKLVRAEIRTLSQNIGYVMGSGDEIPDALRQIGLQVVLFSDADLASIDLSKFDAIVTGVRAFNTRAALRANFQRLLDYVEQGGTLVVQYNVLEGFPGRESRDPIKRLGPYPIQLSRDRVTQEDSPIQIPNPNHPLLRTPNPISVRDFDGWIQERGLYFPKEFDPRYESLFAAKDPGEEWLPGGMLYTRYGKGAYIFTAYSWFRQLPAGVPGAYRIFANLISAGRARQ
ncbi:MAG: PIG-L family deacetylase [Bryobacteraceae bacterium]|nr:PIG-L family deacetylase [Bryobacteraceae bacterium]MDW8378705.1 PIG-L family deacetylase [Bryobacterales bacterium]